LTARDLCTDSIAPALHDKLLDLFRQYLFVGGMPAAVAQYQESRSLGAVATIHRDLLATLRDDFAKYADRVHHHRLRSVFASVPRQLGRKFGYAAVDRSERAAALERAVELLCLARVCRRVRATPAIGVPVGADADDRFFKLLFLDVGLVSTALGLDLVDLEAGDLTLANEGALAEQVVGQLLSLGFAADREPELHYWRRGERGSEAEVDYVIQHGSKLVPVEVKAGTSGTLKSLHWLMAARRWRRAVRFNADLPSVVSVRAKTVAGTEAKYDLLSLPMYLTEQLQRLLSDWTP
jgi:predicted AAA+ superfamily ATPase